jgi:hypothetical protein
MCGGADTHGTGKRCGGTLGGRLARPPRLSQWLLLIRDADEIAPGPELIEAFSGV